MYCLYVAVSTYQLPSMPMGVGVWRSSTIKLAEPFFSRLHAEGQVVTSGTEWSTLAKQEFLLQCPSVACNCKRGHDAPQHTAQKLAAEAQCQHQVRQAALCNTQGWTVG